MKYLLAFVTFFAIQLGFVENSYAECSRMSKEDLSKPPQWLKPYTASYIIYRDGDKTGKASRSLKVANDIWELTSYTSAKAYFFKDKRTEKSTFSWKASFQPLSYYYQIKNTFKKKITKESFDWDLKIVRGSRDKDRQWQFPITDGLADPLNHQILIRKQLITLDKNKSLATEADKAITLSFNVSSKGQAQTREYQIIGEETLTTNAGDFDTIKLQRVRGNRKTIFWMAKKLNFVPIKIYQEKDGDEQATMLLHKFDQITP